MNDVTGVIQGMPNWKAVGPDSLPAEVLSTLSLSGNFIIYSSTCGEREASPSSRKMRPSKSSIKRRIALTATTTEGFAFCPLRQSIAENGRVPPQQLLGGQGDTPRRAVRFSPSTLDNRHAVRRAPIARTRTSEENPPLHVLHRPPESL